MAQGRLHLVSIPAMTNVTTAKEQCAVKAKNRKSPPNFICLSAKASSARNARVQHNLPRV